MDDIRLQSSLPAGQRSAHDTVPRHFGPPGAVDYRTQPGRQARSDDPALVFAGMTERQPRPIANVNALKGTAYSFKNRQIISRWIRDVCAAFKLRTTTFNLGVQLCDLYMINNLQAVPVNKCQCVALACIWLAAKFEELDQHVPPSQQLSDVCDRAYPPSEIIDAEEKVLTSLKWRLPHTTSTNFLYFFLHVLTHNAGFEAAPLFERQPQAVPGAAGAGATRYLLLKPGSLPASSASAGPPSAGPLKPEVPDEWVDVTQLVQNAQAVKAADLVERALVEKLCAAMGVHGNVGAHTTVLQLLGKSVVLAYKIRAGSLLAPLTSSSSQQQQQQDAGIECVFDGSGVVRLFLRIDKQDGTFSECRGVTLLRGPNSELLRHTDALTREALLHVEFLPCHAHEMGLAILTSALIATSSDTAEISLLMAMLLRRLKIDATPGAKWVAATSLLCEKAAAAGVIGANVVGGGPEAAAAPEQQAAGAVKVIKERMKIVLDSCCALSAGGGSSRSKPPQQQQQQQQQDAVKQDEFAGL